MQNSMLSAVQHFYPDTWDVMDYRNKRYQLIEVAKYSTEYRNLESKFNIFGIRVQRIRRIQNPYLFGGYLLRKEQLKYRNINVIEKTMYHAVNSQELFIALEYNLDTRRYNNNTDKCPILYANPQEAIKTTQEEIIMCKVITNNSNNNRVVSECDTERLPEYVIKVA